MSQTQSQRRAADALRAVYALRDASDDAKLKDRFRSYAQSLPAMVQMNGLGQTAAFCRSRMGGGPADAAYQQLYSVMSAWLTDGGQPYEGGHDLLDALTQGDMASYRAAQSEVLAYLEWVKRFAAAFLPKVEDDVSGAGSAAGTDRA